MAIPKAESRYNQTAINQEKLRKFVGGKIVAGPQDNLLTISAQTGVPHQVIAQLNGIQAVTPGQTLKLPTGIGIIGAGSSGGGFGNVLNPQQFFGGALQQAFPAVGNYIASQSGFNRGFNPSASTSNPQPGNQQLLTSGGYASGSAPQPGNQQLLTSGGYSNPSSPTGTGQSPTAFQPVNNQATTGALGESQNFWNKGAQYGESIGFTNPTASTLPTGEPGNIGPQKRGNVRVGDIVYDILGNPRYNAVTGQWVNDHPTDKYGRPLQTDSSGRARGTDFYGQYGGRDKRLGKERFGNRKSSEGGPSIVTPDTSLVNLTAVNMLTWRVSSG